MHSLEAVDPNIEMRSIFHHLKACRQAGMVDETRLRKQTQPIEKEEQGHAREGIFWM